MPVGTDQFIAWNVFYREQNVCHTRFSLAAVRCPHFSKTIPNGGRAVLTLAQSTRNESVEVARLEFLKRTRERKLRKVLRGFCRICVIQCHPSPGLIRPIAISHLED